MQIEERSEPHGSIDQGKYPVKHMVQWIRPDHDIGENRDQHEQRIFPGHFSFISLCIGDGKQKAHDRDPADSDIGEGVPHIHQSHIGRIGKLHSDQGH